MYARPGFAIQTIKGIIRSVVISLGIIHERDDQNIQGGIPGEHFHLTEDEHSFVQELFEQGVEQKIYEPVMAEAELVLTLSGDCLVVFGGSYAS